MFYTVACPQCFYLHRGRQFAPIVSLSNFAVIISVGILMPHTIDQSNHLSPLIFMGVPTEGDIIVPFWTQFCKLFVLRNVFPGLILCPKARGLPTVISG